jgi:carnitine-CoA ligase
VAHLVAPSDDDPGAVGLDPAFVLPTRIAWWAVREPDRPFLQEVTGRSATYGEFVYGVRSWCTRLAALGVGAGDRVISALPTSIDAASLWLAAGLLDAVEVPVNPDLRGSFLEHVLRDPGARWCFVRPEQQAVADAAVSLGLEVVVVERDGSYTHGVEAMPITRFPDPAAPSCVIYTSGTTGASKGAVISWAQMSATIGRIPRSWLNERDVVYSYHPMFHVTGRSPLPAMSDVGGRIVLREKLSVGEFWADVRRFGCTTTTVNTALLLTAPEQPDDADNPLRVAFTGGARALARRFASRFDVQLIEAYGSTEVGFPIVHRGLADDAGRSCGYLRRGYDARVVDEQGDDVPDETPGELLIRPPARPLLTAGYLGRDDLTASVIVDGWYRTGDRLVRHADGSFEFVDRMKDTIRRMGENISSTALEAVVLQDADVAECAVLGAPDPVAGQEVYLAVIPRAGSGLTPEMLHGRLSAALPRHMVPRYVVFVDDFPRTATNKVRKPDVLAQHPVKSVWSASPRRATPST